MPSEEKSARAGSTAGSGSEGSKRRPPQVEVVVAALLDEVKSIAAAFSRAAFVEKQRWKLRLQDSVVKVGAGVCAGIVGLCFAVSSALLIVVGIRRGLAVLTDDAWWADVVAGLLIAGALGGAFYGALRLMHRSALTKVRRALGTPAANGSGRRSPSARVP